MAKAKPKSFHHGDLKRVLFDVALARLDVHGAEGVTIRAVARDAGVSHGAPVNHYADRCALLTALARAQFETLLAEIEARLQKGEGADGPRIDAFAEAIVDFGLRYPHRYRLLWRPDLIDQREPELLAVMDQIYDRLCAEMSKGLETSGSDAHFDQDTYAVALWSLLHGYVDLRLSGMFEPSKDGVSGAPREEAILQLFRRALPGSGVV
ncbi:MAG: TetR/AcrR family transcriptional regulator [Myxococcota bacterium]